MAEKLLCDNQRNAFVTIGNDAIKWAKKVCAAPAFCESKTSEFGKKKLKIFFCGDAWSFLGL